MEIGFSSSVGMQGYSAPVAPAVSAAPAAPSSAAPAAQATPAADMVFGGALPTSDMDAAKLAQDRATAKDMDNKFARDCQTCKSRKYQDGSDDPGVSFQTPQHIDPASSASVVLGHEREHVMREQAKANSEGGKVISQAVVLHGAICPECGRYYIAGGTTYTTTRTGGEKSPAQNQNGEAVKELNAYA